jgi:hypothetical protein
MNHKLANSMKMWKENRNKRENENVSTQPSTDVKLGRSRLWVGTRTLAVVTATLIWFLPMNPWTERQHTRMLNADVHGSMGSGQGSYTLVWR